MTTIVIKDLPENIDLDRQAMVAIMGGARTRGRPTFVGRTIFNSASIVNYPVGFRSKRLADANAHSAGYTPRK